MDIYRNPNINEKTPSEYMALSDIGIIPFSVKELD